MAGLTKKQRSELRHIRNEQFKRNNLKGVQSRHPEKGATIYSERPNCVRLESRFTKRPAKCRAYYGDVDKEAKEKPILPPKDSAFENKLIELGITKDQWGEWLQLKTKGGHISLHDYIRGLASE